MNESAGIDRNVIELIAVPTIESPTTQPENLRPPRKYSSVSRFLRAK